MADTPATRVNGAAITSLVSCPVPSGAGGFWWDGNTTGPKWRKADGTDVTLGSGGSTGNYTFSANSMDLSGAAVATLFPTIATGVNSGGSAFGFWSNTGSRLSHTQRALTTGTQTSAFTITGGAHTALTASTEYTDCNFSLNRTVQFSTGALATNRWARWQPPTVAFVAASTLGSTATVWIDGAPKAGTNATLTRTAGQWIQTGADAGQGLVLQANSSTQSGALLNCYDTSFNSLMSMQMSDTGQSVKLVASSQLNGGYEWLTASTPTGTVHALINSGAMQWEALSHNWYDAAGSVQSGSLDTTNGLQIKRLSNLASQNLSFSATPAFDPTAGNFIHIGTITGNITGPTMVAGRSGERCTIIFQKDATAGTYTITTSWGSNARLNSTAIAFTSTASTCIIINFIWDDRLSTPQWVETGRVGPI